MGCQTQGILWNPSRAIEFFPSKQMSEYEKYNAIVRFSTYVSLIIFLYNRMLSIFITIPLTLAITYYLHKLKLVHKSTPFTSDKEIDENEPLERTCVMPTTNNPFMNVLLTDYVDDPNRPEACDITDPEVKKEVDGIFWENNIRM